MILLLVLFFAVHYAYAEWNKNRSDSSTLSQIEDHLEKIADQLEKINYNLEDIEEVLKRDH